MSWAERLEKKISEKGGQAGVSKVSKAPKPPFRHFRHFGAGGISKNNSEAAKRFAYRFALHNGEGAGTYLTDEADLDEARASLAAQYGTRLALVVRA